MLQNWDKGVAKTIVYTNSLNECLENYIDATKHGIKTDNLSVWYVDKDHITRGLVRAIVSKDDSDDDICAMIEHINGGYYGLMRREHTKRFNTLGELRDHLFNIDYNTTLAIL